MGTGEGHPDSQQPFRNNPGGSGQKESCGLHHSQTPFAASSSRGPVGKGPCLWTSIPPVLNDPSSATSDTGEGGSQLRTPPGETGRGSGPSACPSHSRAPSTIKQKLTQAAPTSGAGLEGGRPGVSSSLGQMVWRAARTGPINSPGPPTSSPIKQTRIQQHRPQRGRRAVNARQCTQLLGAPCGFPKVVLAAAAAAAEAAAAPAAPAFRASLGLSTWSEEQLRASFRWPRLLCSAIANGDPGPA